MPGHLPQAPHVPPELPRTIIALVGENENGALRSHSQALMAAAVPWGFACHVVDIQDGSWLNRLAELIQGGILLAWAGAGVGARLPHPDGPLWDVIGVPFISVMADSPCQMPANHSVAATHVANGYVFRDWLDMQRRLVRSPQISSLLPQGVPANAARDATPWSRRAYRMMLVKTGFDPARHRAAWATMPPRFRAVLEDCAAASLQGGAGDITGLFLDCLDHHGLSLEGRPEVLFGLMYQVDQYVRDVRSTAMVRALLPLPVDIVGRGWDHVRTDAGRARFHAALDADTLPGLFAETQFVVNTMPNFAHGTHERVLNGFAARACVVTNENADMRQRFGALPSYFGVSTEAADLADRLSGIYHGAERFDEQTQPALDLVEQEFSAEGFMRGLIELSLEVRAAAAYGTIKS